MGFGGSRSLYRGCGRGRYRGGEQQYRKQIQIREYP